MLSYEKKNKINCKVGVIDDSKLTEISPNYDTLKTIYIDVSYV